MADLGWSREWRGTWGGDPACEPADRGEGAGVLPALPQAVLRGAEQVPEAPDEAPALAGLHAPVLPPARPRAGPHLNHLRAGALEGPRVPPVPPPAPPSPPAAQVRGGPQPASPGGQGQGPGAWGAASDHWGEEGPPPGGQGGPGLLRPGHGEGGGDEEEEGEHGGLVLAWPLLSLHLTPHHLTPSHVVSGHEGRGAPGHWRPAPLSPRERAQYAGCGAWCSAVHHGVWCSAPWCSKIEVDTAVMLPPPDFQQAGETKTHGRQETQGGGVRILTGALGLGMAVYVLKGVVSYLRKQLYVRHNFYTMCVRPSVTLLTHPC